LPFGIQGLAITECSESYPFVPCEKEERKKERRKKRKDPLFSFQFLSYFPSFLLFFGFFVNFSNTHNSPKA